MNLEDDPGDAGTTMRNSAVIWHSQCFEQRKNERKHYSEWLEVDSRVIWAISGVGLVTWVSRHISADVKHCPSLLAILWQAVQRPIHGSRISTFYPYRRLHNWIVLFNISLIYDWTCITWILFCLCLAISLLKIRRKKWRLKKGKDVERAECGWNLLDIRAVEVSVLCYTFWIMDGPISRRIAQDLSYPLIAILQQECTRTSCPEENGFIFVSLME